MLRKFIDVDGYEWLPCLDGSYVAVDGAGFLWAASLGHIQRYYGPLRLVEVAER